MVEGPKVVLKAEKFNCLLTSVLIAIDFATINSESIYTKDVCRVSSIGKELFLEFTNCESAIRLHFQMSGRQIIVKSGTPVCKSALNSRSVLTALLKFDKYDVYIYDSSISIKSTDYIRVVEQRRCRDICADQFSLQEAVQLLMTDQRPIQESIMDQHILPGVGNIIKCEGLFLSRVNPFLISSELGFDALCDLVVNLHTFSIKWLSYCRANKAIPMTVYNLNSCSVCSSTICLVRANTNARITYYCQYCQPLSPAAAVSLTKTLTQQEQPNSLDSSSTNDGKWVDLFDPQKCKCPTANNSTPRLMRVRKNGDTHNR